MYIDNEQFTNLNIAEETINDREYVDCRFENCAFEALTLVHCRFTDCVFINCTINDIKTKSSEVKFAQLHNCSIRGVNWGLLMPTGGFGEPIDKLENCSLKYNHFMRMNFRRFNWTGSSITGTTFAECNLQESNFSGCDLTDSEFFRCNLEKADFRDSKDYRIDVPGCQMKNARFSMPEAVNLLYSLGIKVDK